MGAGGDDDHVHIQLFKVVDLRVQVHNGAAPLELPLVPFQKLLILLLEGHGRRGVEHAAQPVGLLVQIHPVPPICRLDGGLHAADAAADHRDALRIFGGGFAVFRLVVGPGVQHAPAHLHVHGVDVGPLSVQPIKGQTRAVAGDAGPHVIEPPLLDLGDVFGIAQQLPPHAHGVDPARGNGFRRRIRLQTPRTNHRLGGKLLDVLHVGKVHVQRRVHRRMGPEPGVVGAVIAVEHVIAGCLKDLHRPLGFLHRAPDLNEGFARHRSLVIAAGHGAHGVADRHREIFAADLLDLLNDLAGKAQPVFQASAVRVGAVVGIGHGKLVEEIPLVDRVDLHAVAARFLAAQRRLPEGIDESLDHPLGEKIHLDRGVPNVRLVIVRGGPPPFVGQDRRSQGVQNALFHEGPQDRRQQHGASRARADLEKDLCTA